jgi:hypothetical protein
MRKSALDTVYSNMYLVRYFIMSRGVSKLIAELRAAKKAIEMDIHNRCFICGIDRMTFDRHAEGMP